MAWTRTFGGAGNDTGSAISLTSDGGFIVAGSTYSSGNGGSDVYLIKTDGDGNLQWEKTYGGPQDDEGFSVLQTYDGNYVVAGYTRSYGNGSADVYLLKVDQNGNELWSKTCGGAADDFGYSLRETPDGGYVIAGYTYSNTSGGSDAYLVRADRDGNLLWQKTYGGSADDQVFSLNATSDGGYLMAGGSRSFTPAENFYVVKTDADGNLQWQDGYPQGYALASRAYSANEVPDGGYVINGWYDNSNGVLKNIRLALLDPDGQIHMTMHINPADGSTYYSINDSGLGFGPVISADEPVSRQYFNITARSMVLTSDGNAAITGWIIDNKTNRQLIYVMKARISGFAHVWEVPMSFSANDSSQAILQTPDGNYILTGWTHKGSGGSDLLLVKLGGTPVTPAPAGTDYTQKAAVAAVAVAVGSGLGLLGIYFGRLWDAMVALVNKAVILLKVDLGKLLPIDTAFDFVFGLAKTYSKSILFRKLAQIEEDKARESLPLLKGFSSRELLIVAVASLLLGIAYLVSKKMDLLTPYNLALYGIMGGFVIILHDLTHRYYANKYHAVVEYKFWGLGAVIMFVTAFLFGLVYAVPARTIINDVKKLSVREQAIIYLSGPMMSAVLAIVFVLLVPAGGFFAIVGLLGVSMNLLTAVYSLMPVDPLDGVRVYLWKKPVWLVAFLPLLVLYVLVTVYLL